ncbi:adherens junction formation factor afadin isoform X13 [Rhodnius prolixus]|uniref:adherens junction formation factor afadin isoform X13 n=1 Tax=Rhodnius prolixus TaxID=13249 RepID=UPI003D18FB38
MMKFCYRTAQVRKMNQEMAMVVRRTEEREALRSVIAQWNANRLDLFELSEPNQDLEFHGVMRFYFQDSGQKVATKCIRVASDATAQVVIETLIEKFRPDMRMLSIPEYALYEIHENGDERRLEPEEKPLLVQLNWHKDDREGRFLLRRIDDKTNMPEGTFQEGGSSFRRKLSKREKKQLKKQEKLNRMKSSGGIANDENDAGVAEKLYTELPETSFTRSISNPEAVMRRRRQQKLERKLQQFRSKDGGPDTGGTLKIYGEALCKDVPYKTLLLSIGDTAAQVVKEMLMKYGLDKEEPQHYCLVQVNTGVEDPKENSHANNNTINNREYILDDDECPLAILMNHPMTRGSIMFHVRRRPADYHPRKRKKKPQQGKWGQHNELLDYRYEDGMDRLPFFLELNPDGTEIAGGTAKRYRLQPNVTEVGSERGSPHGHGGQSLQLFGPNIQPRHCVIAHTEGIVTVTPCSRDAETYVNGQRIYETTILQNGATVKFGRIHNFRFLDPCHDERVRQRHDSSRSPHDYSYDRQSGRDETSSLSVGNGPTTTSTPSGNPLNYETTFDVDGNVETRSTSSQGNKDDTRSQRSVSSSREGNRLSNYERYARGNDPILPAVLEIREETEEALLHAIVTDLEPTAPGFKLAPAYTLYLFARYRASTHYRPELTPTERAHRLTLMLAKVAKMIHNVILERYCEVKCLALWLANASELLHFLKTDKHISAFSLDAQDTLADAVQLAFRHLVACLQGELSTVMPNFLSDRDDLSHDPEDSSTASVLGVLSSAMSLLRRCRVNAALTIQLFSQLFHFVNVWAFNKVVAPNSIYCSRSWGLRLKARLAQIEVWAEKQGLELAAECHLARLMQAAHLLQAPKYTCDDLATLSSTCFKLNSLQLRALLQRYQCTPDEPRIPHDIVDNVVRVAENLADELARSDGREVRLEEEPELALPFLLPEDGYSCEVVRGVPPGLVDFVAPLQHAGLCRLTAQPTSNGLWTVYMGPSISMVRSPSAMSNRSTGFVPTPQEPEVQIIKLHKSNNGMGLSIVAARGAGHDRSGIYIKSVVKGGAADADGRLQAGDQLLKVDGQSLVGISQEKAAEYLVRTGPIVTLEVAKQGAIYHGLATLLSQPSPVIGRGPRRMSERDLPSRVHSEQQNQQGRGQHPPHVPQMHSSKSVPSLNTGNHDLERPMMNMNQTVIGTSTMPRPNHEVFNPGYSRTSSTNSIPQKSYEGQPPHNAHQIRSRSSQNLTDHRPNTLPGNHIGPRQPSNPNLIPNNYGGHQSPYGPPNQQPLSPYQQHHLTHPGNQQPYQHHQPPQHIHQLPSIQQQNSPVGDNGERFYQNLSIYRNQEVHNGYPPHHNGVGRGKLPSPQDERNPGAMQKSLRGSQSSLQSRSTESNANIARDRPASAYLPNNYHGQLPPQGMPGRSQSSRDMLRQEAKMQEMNEEVRRREMRVTSPQHRPPMGGIGSPIQGSPLRCVGNSSGSGPGSGYNDGGYLPPTSRMPQQSDYSESPPPPPPPPTSTHPLYQPALRLDSRYSASVGDPPRGSYYPASPGTQQSRQYYYVGSNPWQREEREREAERRRDVVRHWRDQQISELINLPQRNAQQEEHLRALKLEKEFERRAEEEVEEEEEEDQQETAERVQGLLRVAQQNDERRSMRTPQPNNQSAASQTLQIAASQVQNPQVNGTNTRSTISSSGPTYTHASSEEKARLQRLKDLKMKQAEVEAERLKKKQEEEMKNRSDMQPVSSYQAVTSRPTVNQSSASIRTTSNLRLDNLVINTPSTNNSSNYHNNNGYSTSQVSPPGQRLDQMVGGINAPQPPERGSSFAVMSQATQSQMTRTPTTSSPPTNTTTSTPSLGTAKRVSFQDPPPPPPPVNPAPPLDNISEDPNHFINEAENLLASPTSPDSTPFTGNTPGVIGAQEVYRDPRTKRLAEQQHQKLLSNKGSAVPEKLSFKEKMKMFAMETGEDATPKDKVKISRAQRDIDNIGSPTTPNNNTSAQGNS